MTLSAHRFLILASAVGLLAGCAHHSTKSGAPSDSTTASPSTSASTAPSTAQTTAVRTVDAPLQADARARLFQPVPGKAVIYVIRNDDWFWVGPRGLTLDGKSMGELKRDTYMRWEVAPGKHEIVSETEPPAIIALDTKPGGVYYVWQDIFAAVFNPHNRLRLVDYTTARLVLEHSAMLERSPPL